MVDKPRLLVSYPLQKVVGFDKGSTLLACGHEMWGADTTLKRRHCTKCPPRDIDPNSKLAQKERRLAQEAADQEARHKAYELADRRPCAVCCKLAKAQGSFWGGPALCDEPCFKLFWKNLRLHPKRKVVAIQLEPGQEDWWITAWWYITLECGCVTLSKDHDPGYPWLHCFQCPIELDY